MRGDRIDVTLSGIDRPGAVPRPGIRRPRLHPTAARRAPGDFGVVVSTEETPFDQLQPDSITIAQLVDGAAAIDLLQKVQLL